LEGLGKCGQNLVGRADAGKTWKDLFKCEAVLLRILCGAGIFDYHERKAETGALAHSGLDANIRGDTGEDNGVDATGLELLL
jgi:hypothetical protein